MYALCVPVFLHVYTLVLSSSSIVFTFEGNPPSFRILTTAYLTSPHHSLSLLSLVLACISLPFTHCPSLPPFCSLPPPPPQQLHSLGREHGKTKASHQKLLSESQERETQLTQVAEARERLLMERQNVAQAHHVQQTRMQATIAQQSKLIDYLQGTPNSRLKIKKVLAVFPASHTPGFHKQ